MNITDFLWRHIHAWPERTAVIQDGRPINFRALGGSVETFATRLALAGVRRGDCVEVAVKNPFGYLCIVLALARMGAIMSPFKADSTTELKEALIRRHQAKFVVHDTADTWRSEQVSPANHIDAASIMKPLAPGEGISAPKPAADVDAQSWFIALSSGTTGVPKSIPQTHERTMLSVALGHPPNAAERYPIVAIVADLSISMAMNHLLRTLMGGAAVCLMTTWHPDKVAQRLLQDRPARLITTTALAGRLVEYCASQPPGSRSPRETLQAVMVSGSPVSPALRAGIEKYLSPNIEINYGSTEGGGLAVANSFTLAERPKSAGRIHPWVQARAVDDNFQPLPPGHVGLLGFSTPVLVDGYIGDDAATARSFRDGWFYPGDMGSVDAAGYLELTGRVDDRINLGGRKIDPVRIEQVLESHPAVQEAAVVAVPAGESGRTVMVAVVVQKSEVDADALKQLCGDKLGSSMMPAVVIFVPALPRNTAGKVMRDAVAARVRLSKPA